MAGALMYVKNSDHKTVSNIQSVQEPYFVRNTAVAKKTLIAKSMKTVGAKKFAVMVNVFLCRFVKQIDIVRVAKFVTK